MLDGDLWCAWSKGKRLSIHLLSVSLFPFLLLSVQHTPDGGDAHLSWVTILLQESMYIS